MPWTLDGPEPTRCPWCGEPLERRNREGARSVHCVACDRTLYRNPVPVACMAVVEDDSVLLIERGSGPNLGEWALPGGHLEHDEPPHVAAARELEEETGLSVDPSVLSLLGTGFIALEYGHRHEMVSVNYAVSSARTTGVLEAGSDAAAARYWSRDELFADGRRPTLRASGLEQVLSAISEFG
ncbi:NUDIX hydrolase [Natronosalvus rutilus]|uniref:NUDIX hydrolase n=1 Tax=Natronosalvus rutilus TaxID=2953753 RepID=A0A9E7N7Y8_9EURY|nr:NUDIX hydrolase [Natronosalvus rutilus]UTF53372.1 NUDIX hydrolase [Natronosalvus rutilus]